MKPDPYWRAARALHLRDHTQKFRAVVCLKGGKWLTMRGEYTHPAWDEWKPSPHERLIKAVVMAKYPTALHVFILGTWTPKDAIEAEMVVLAAKENDDA